MKKKWAIPFVIALSLFFNIGFALSIQVSNQTPPWLFVDLGPAVMQDSYYIRSPGLESPYGMIGDTPGGYPLYSGNPLQSGYPEISTDSSEIVWYLSSTLPNMDAILLAIGFAVVPVVLILILGRRSYGNTKTQ